MMMVDTSVWIDVLRDKTGSIVNRFRDFVGPSEILFCRFIQFELLQGARDENEWRKLDTYLKTQYYLDAGENTWRKAALVFLNLRQLGLTVRSPIDCCIAQIAAENSVLLVHRDQDFVRISEHYPLEQHFFQIESY